MLQLAFPLPTLPPKWSEDEDFIVHKRISKCFKKAIEPAGVAFAARVRRHKSKRTLEEDYNLTQALLDAAGEDDNEEEDEVESKALLRSDPSKWKTQDHYAVLGLSKKRYLANDEDIKRAYRRKVLKHHPDKIAAVGGSDSFFKCIQKAWEVLTDKKKRRQFDSCDPTFDESIPSLKATGDFFEIYREKMASEGRFSKVQPVPPLGDMNSTREEVEAFYSFFFNMESWRTFEMRDVEDTDKADSRDEKRWLDRKNVAGRKKHKKEDTQRLNKLVEQCFSVDPRIKLFKEQERYAKNTKKREREAAEKAAAEEAARVAEAARLEAERLEAEKKEKAAAEKKDKDSAKNAIKKSKKTIRRIFRDNSSFVTDEKDVDAIAEKTFKLEQLLSTSDLDVLEALRVKFEKAVSLGPSGLAKVLDESSA